MANVFLSWSGDASQAVAIALYEWLPAILQNVQPFMSSEDLRKGGRWNKDLGDQLEKASFGIICLTPENLEAPWIMFEAGAISKFVIESNVSPFLVRVKPSELPKPLTQFNATIYEKDDFKKLVKTINESKTEESVSEALLNRSFEACWPQLDIALSAAVALVDKTLTKAKPAPRSTEASIDRFDAILQELVVLTRAQSQILNSPRDLLPPAYLSDVLSNTKQHRELLDLSHPVWNDLIDAWRHLRVALEASDLHEAKHLGERMASVVSYIERRYFDITRRGGRYRPRLLSSGSRDERLAEKATDQPESTDT